MAISRTELDGPRPSVCIVSDEFLGLSNNGGIGTAMTGLAMAMAKAGFPVTMLFTDGVTVAESGLKAAASRYGALGINFEALRPADLRPYAGPAAEAGFAMPAAVYQWFSTRRFDIVHFSDTGGLGHLCLAAKRLGLAFADTHLAVGVHSPHRWIHSLNGSVPDNLLGLCVEQAERASIASADTLWSPSQYLRNWLAADGFRLPADTIVQQYVMPPDEHALAAAPATAPPREAKVEEIVFFGRLEERKGLRIFCEAIDQIDDKLASRRVAVSFMGRATQIDGIPTLQWIAQRCARWRTRPKLMTNLSQPEAVAYLKGAGRLAVIASPADNSPCTIYESTNFGIPFLAAATGGIPELVHAGDQMRVMFAYNPEALAHRLHAALDEPPTGVRPAIGNDENSGKWAALHENWGRRARAQKPVTTGAGQIAVVIRDSGDGEALDMTLASLASVRDRIAACLVVSRLARAAPPGLSALGGELVSAGAAPGALAALAIAGAAASILFVEAGCAINPAALARHIDGLAGSGFDGVIPAGTRRSGQLVTGVGNGAMLAFHHGLMFTGGALITSASVRRALADGLSTGDPVTELMDKALLLGTEMIASPESAFVIADRLPRPAIVSERMALYAERAGPKAIGALLGMAAQAERDGGLKSLARRLGTRIVASRAGFLGPTLARLWRARATLLGPR